MRALPLDTWSAVHKSHVHSHAEHVRFVSGRGNLCTSRSDGCAQMYSLPVYRCGAMSGTGTGTGFVAVGWDWK